MCRCRLRRSITDHSWSFVAALLLLLLGVSRPGVLETAGRRFCCCRLLRTDDRDSNPRFDINMSTPLSERCSPSFANAASSTAPLRNVKLVSLSANVALYSSQVVRSWSFNVFRHCTSVRRVVGMTLLSFTDGATDCAVRSRRLTSLLPSSAVASPMVSVVPPTMTISLIVCVSAASSIICFNLVECGSRIWLILSGPSNLISRSKLLPTSSVSTLGIESTVSVIGLPISSLSFRMSCCCSPTRTTSCLFVSSRRVIMDSIVDDLSRRRCTRTG